MAKSFESAIVNIITSLFPGAVDIYKQQVARQIITEAGVGDGGKIAGWANDIAAALQLRDVSYSGGTLSGQVVLPAGNNEARASVLMGGNFGIGDPPMSKPGVATWDDNMQGQSVHVPAEMKPWQMPPQYLRDPMISWQFMDNAGKKCQDRILEYFSQATSGISVEINRMMKELSGGG